MRAGAGRETTDRPRPASGGKNAGLNHADVRCFPGSGFRIRNPETRTDPDEEQE
ncbi:MAG: hypothetical protein ACOC9D_05240 [Thermodesulfobacteriota bacterium]